MDYKKPQSTIVYGGAGIYPLTTADQVILADGSRLEKNGKIGADSAADSAKLGGKAPEYYIQSRNLLDNSDFRNPVNQRGQTGYVGTQYTVDRWFLWSQNSKASVGLGNDYVELNPEEDPFATLTQRFPKGYFSKEKTYTLAYLDTAGEILISNNPITHMESYDYVQIVSDTWIGIRWVALYEGSYTADTLPPYVPKGYAAELAECQRYYIEIGIQPINGWCYDWGQVNVFVPTPTLMRQENPSVILNTASPNFFIGSTPYDATLIGGKSISNGILVTYSHAAMVRGQCIMPEFSAKISADL